MTIRKFLWLVLFSSWGAVLYAQSSSHFEKGNSYYNSGKYVEAIEEYEAILNADQQSAELYFNLGNAHYKLNNIAPSIYYYEKALQLNPTDKEIKNNLEFAQNMTIDDIGLKPEVGFRMILNEFSALLTYDGWAKLSVILMVAFSVFLITYFFSHTTTSKRALFISSLSFLGLALLSLAMAYNSYSIYLKDQPAIVFNQESQVKTEPNLRGALAFTLHEGTKVQILETVDEWKKIELTDGTTGWIESENLKMLKDSSQKINK